MTTEQRALLERRAEGAHLGPKHREAICAALADIDAQAAELELLRAAGRIHGYLDELDNCGFACDCVVCREWRAKYGKGA